jgi:hypothetical protein
MYIYLLFNGLLGIIVSSSVGHLDKKYIGRCLSFHDTKHTSIPCDVAMYTSNNNFVVSSAITMISDKLCSVKESDHSSYNKKIAVVNRGECSFEQKTKNAALLGYLGLIIVNIDETTFPIGGSPSTSAESLIPTVLVGNTSIIMNIMNESTYRNIRMDIIYGKMLVVILFLYLIC